MDSKESNEARALELAVKRFSGDDEADQQLSRSIAKPYEPIDVGGVFSQVIEIDEQLILVTLGDADYLIDGGLWDDPFGRAMRLMGEILVQAFLNEGSMSEGELDILAGIANIVVARGGMRIDIP